MRGNRQPCDLTLHLNLAERCKSLGGPTTKIVDLAALGRFVNAPMKDKLVYRGDWNFSVRKDFVLNPKISMQAKLLWIALRSFCSSTTEEAWPSIETLCSALDCARDTIYKYTSELIEKGFLKKEQVKENGLFSHTLYTVIDKLSNPCPEKPCPEISATEKLDAKNSQLQMEEIPSNKKKGLPTWIQKNNDLLLAEAIYDAYPRKEAKKPAITAILRAMKKADGLMLLEKTNIWAKAKAGTELKFIPQAASWFNAERYNDDPEVWVSTTAQSSDTRTQLHLLDELRRDEGNLISQLERSFGKGRAPIEAQLASVRAKMTQIKAKLRL